MTKNIMNTGFVPYSKSDTLKTFHQLVRLFFPADALQIPIYRRLRHLQPLGEG